MITPKTLLTPLGLGIAALLISLPWSLTTEILNPDGQRYLFNGILLHDLIRDGAFTDVYNYATAFYGKYPAFNLPYGPPFFAAQFALVFSIFGISIVAARLLVTAYTIAALFACWYVIRKIDERESIAALASCLFLFNSLTITYSREVGSELPVIFYSFLALYTGYQFIESEKRGYGLITALLLGLGYLTKQHIVPLGFGIALYALIRHKSYLICRRETALSAIVLLILTVPYTWLTMMYTSQDFGMQLFPPISTELLLSYLKSSLRFIPVIAVLSFAGFVVGITKRNKLCLLCFCWLICWYIFFTFVYGYYTGELRYILIILPALVYPAALAVHFLLSTYSHLFIRTVFLSALIGYGGFCLLDTPTAHLSGYAIAGKHICENAKNSNVLFMSDYDGNFLYGIRRSCSTQSPFVFRSDQWLANRLWWGELKDPSSVKSTEEISDFIRNNMIGFVVIERKNPALSTYPEYNNLTQLLSARQDITHVDTIAISSNVKKFKNRELDIYRTPFVATHTNSLQSIPIKPSAFQH